MIEKKGEVKGSFNKKRCIYTRVTGKENRKDENYMLEEIEEIINCDADAETKCKMISNILTAKGVSEMKKGYDGTCPVCGRNVFSGLKKCQCWHCDNVLIWENGHWKRKLMS